MVNVCLAVRTLRLRKELRLLSSKLITLRFSSAVLEKSRINVLK
jgi:hypothetical protein